MVLELVWALFLVWQSLRHDHGWENLLCMIPCYALDCLSFYIIPNKPFLVQQEFNNPHSVTMPLHTACTPLLWLRASAIGCCHARCTSKSNCNTSLYNIWWHRKGITQGNVHALEEHLVECERQTGLHLRPGHVHILHLHMHGMFLTSHRIPYRWGGHGVYTTPGKYALGHIALH